METFIVSENEIVYPNYGQDREGTMLTNQSIVMESKIVEEKLKKAQDDQLLIQSSKTDLDDQNRVLTGILEKDQDIQDFEKLIKMEPNENPMSK